MARSREAHSRGPSGDRAIELWHFALRSYSVLILALDTTTPAGSLAVRRGGAVLAVVAGDPASTHGERLPGEIAHVLDAAGVAARQLDVIAVATGPGPFTGLRIGLAAVQGMALVLRLPVVGVSALDALAHAARLSGGEPAAARLVVWTDARREEVFAAEYRGARDPDGWWAPAEAPLAAAPAALLEQLGDPHARPGAFIGSGAERYRGEIARWSGGAWPVLDAPAALAPEVADVGRILAGRGLAGPPHTLQPLYVRRPDAELERLRRAGA